MDTAADDGRTFKADFTGDGAERLRDRVKEKLKEFMGDYTDDALVGYVIVLLRNGRRKVEARRELNVFLGKDSIPFVSWLWDHLSSNLQLYVQPTESSPEEAAKMSHMDEFSGRKNLQTERLDGNVTPDSEYKKDESTRSHISRRNRGWKTLVPDTEFPLQRTVTEILQSERRTHKHPKRVRTPRSSVPQVGRKRSREREVQPVKMERASKPLFYAPRRLLQFAVRDAVRTVQQSSFVNERAPKRLCSVVSMSTANSVVDERPQRMRSVARVPGLSTVLKAAAEAAGDVTSIRYSGNVFDRLGRNLKTSEPKTRLSDTRDPVLADREYEDIGQTSGPNDVEYDQSRYDGESTVDMSMLDRDDGTDADYTSDIDGFNKGAPVRQQVAGVSQSASANKDNSSLKVQCNVAQDADIVKKASLMDQGPPGSAAANATRKILNISVNVNTWKPPHYQDPRDITQMENQVCMEKNEKSAVELNPRLQHENCSVKAENQKEVAHTEGQQDLQKTIALTSNKMELPKTGTSTPIAGYATTRPLDDANSRIVFVSNVHFAATKDTLSRHFNKFGEVLKVIIATDAATGQPKGSAFVEFLRKESAELALQLNGTSFMSRILKVVLRSSAQYEAGAMFGWPRTMRASPFASRLGGMSFSRGVAAGALRGRLPTRPGARSLQWKRGASASLHNVGMKDPQAASSTTGNPMPSPTGKHLTYVRAESKADRNPDSV